eukprot:TRINITY_DN39_c0_g1_i1.p2 TRINITY_DN39_c0_g1~~TRINITY_DN39_c0_g1_i1.p2  ORF type:complete len:245 (+),score=51.01 TRINITY_DN39_c0_g1_i1:1278-2012(+)
MIVCKSNEELSTLLADYVIGLSQSAGGSGVFHVAVSGGSLPALLSAKLKLKEYSEKVNWAAWRVWFVDERYVPLDHPESNYKATKEALLDHVPIPPQHVKTIKGQLPLEECAADYENQLRGEFGDKVPEFDLILLGMGPDGHTASLFPNHRLLEEKGKWIAPVSDSPKPPPQRVTFTLPLINNAKNVAFVATGDAKKEVLQKILEEGQEVPHGALPSKLVSPKGTLKWFLDVPAAALLKNVSAL